MMKHLGVWGGAHAADKCRQAADSVSDGQKLLEIVMVENSQKAHLFSRTPLGPLQKICCARDPYTIDTFQNIS